MDYRSLNPDRIVETVRTLQWRIEERFPRSSLSQTCIQLLETSRQARDRSIWIARPVLPLRLGAAVLIFLVAAGLGLTLTKLPFSTKSFDLSQFIQTSEAGINDVVLIGAALLFLITLETRLKRHRTLKALHELRAMAHIIDMHQLTKDPEILLARPTNSSPKRSMSSGELARYLDYCSEMLSMIGKVAALYVQRFDDPVALEAVGEIETLTNGLSRKIWQKLMVLHATKEDATCPST